ncbi:MAG: amidohydrolase family protein [Methanomassiliicoccales archaeon]
MHKNNLVIDNATVLEGKELQQTEKELCIIDGTFSNSAGNAEATVIDASGLIAIPCFVNAHIHLNDAPMKDAGVGMGLNDLFHPVRGMKNRVISLPKEQRVGAMASALREMFRNGISVAANFCETDISLVTEATVLSDTPLDILNLVRPMRYFSPDEIKRNVAFSEDEIAAFRQLMELGSGIGLSGTNEYSDASILQLREFKSQLRGMHASENKQTREMSLKLTGKSEVERSCMTFSPDFLVHLVAATPEDISLMAENGVAAVLCPRSNALTGNGIPPLPYILEEGIAPALGTDNLMLNSPDMFREMDFLSRVVRARFGASSVSSRQILSMATAGGAVALGLGNERGCIQSGKRGDLLLLDAQGMALRNSNDIHASIVHRASASDIVFIVNNGNICFMSASMEGRICSQE